MIGIKEEQREPSKPEADRWWHRLSQKREEWQTALRVDSKVNKEGKQET